ncbi:MAG: hypothetical protein ACK6DC_06070 [Planctomycetota bacterium]|jgi:hypothetical protein
MNSNPLCPDSPQFEENLRALVDEIAGELKNLSNYAIRGDCLGVASVAYRVRQSATRIQLHSIEETATRIEESARRNNVDQFNSDIQLLDHQVRWFARRDPTSH